MSLLPPNATPLERAIEAATARAGAIDIDTAATLWNPATCPIAVLPWLAWALSVDSWDGGWSDATKRQAVADAIGEHRRKGTRMSVEAVTSRFDELIHLVEWHEAVPRAAPHTFEVRIPLVTAPGVAPGGTRASAAFAERIVREVARAKPLREHFRVVQELLAVGSVGLFGVARLASWQREPAALVSDTDPSWDSLLQTEDGEPLQADDGSFLDTTP